MAEKNITRKLTTILAADVVGYSRMMAADEEGTLRTLRTYRGIIDGLIAKHQGRLFNTAGDAVLVEFGSAVEAVRFAISMQEELAVRNAELEDDRQMRFRIGINVGDVIIENDDLFGDGVNIAARLEGLAEVGGICISGSTFDQVKNKLSIGFEDMGPQDVKNIPQPVPSFKIVPGSVSVRPEAASPATAAAKVPGRWRLPAVAVAAVVLVAAAGWGGWKYYPRGPKPLSAFPGSFSTASMQAADIEALMAGMTIQGIGRRSGRSFVIRIKPDHTADVETGRKGGAAGTEFRETGKWWAGNYLFCMQFSKFAKGRRMCPRITREGQKITATRGDGSDTEWTLHK